MTINRKSALLCVLTLLLSLAIGPAAYAGGASLDEDDDDQSNAGLNVFGFARDLDRGGPIADVKVSAEIKGHNGSLVTRTDDAGRFKFSGFNKDVSPKDVEVTCSKEGLNLQRAIRRPTGDVILQIDCLMRR